MRTQAQRLSSWELPSRKLIFPSDRENPICRLIQSDRPQYDGLLQLKLPSAVTLVAFADDVALVIVGKYLEDLNNLFSVSFKKYQEYIDFIGQELAKHETEAVLITGRMVVETITVRVGQNKITFQPAIRYLGVMIDARLNLSSRWSMPLLRQQQ